MTAYGFTLFDTAIGRCAIAWSGRGVAGVQLPEAREAGTRARVLQQFPGAIRKGFAVAFKKRALPTRENVEKRGARWRPYRTVASWYLWRAVELVKK